MLLTRLLLNLAVLVKQGRQGRQGMRVDVVVQANNPLGLDKPFAVEPVEPVEPVGRQAMAVAAEAGETVLEHQHQQLIKI